MKQLKVENSDSFALIDDIHFDRLSKFKWFMVESGGIYKNLRKNVLEKHVSLANSVMQTFDVLYDHKDRDSFNNLESNLRKCTYQQNSFNRKKHKNCSSKYKGVYWDKKAHNWRSQITIDYKTLYIGSFDCEIQAALAYDKKARELFGEFANCNFYIT